MKRHNKVLIIGGGTAGITVSAQLLRKNPRLDIAVVEPSDKHYYQPGWTLVGGGVFTASQTVRDEADYIPQGVTWIRDSALRFDPDNNSVVIGSGDQITYDFLVVCCGVQLDWHLIKGLPETLGKNGVCSNYLFNTAPYTYECIRSFQGGKALFSQSGGLIKCGAAPQKIMYLAADNFRRRGILQQSEVSFFTGKPGLLRVPEINAELMKIAARYGIKLHFNANLVEVNGETKEAVFEMTKTDGKDRLTVQFDMFHVAPPMSAPDAIKNSPLAVKDPFGWVDVNRDTLQHNRYKNVFSLGDVANTGDTKTGAAVLKQVPVLVKNLLTAIDMKTVVDPALYNGYTSCPLTTGYGKLLMAEFDHDNRLMPTFPLDPRKERYSMWLLVKYFIPWFYWNRLLRGKI
jgi:sulfide:quinone oxidoreductase